MSVYVTHVRSIYTYVFLTLWRDFQTCWHVCFLNYIDLTPLFLSHLLTLSYLYYYIIIYSMYIL